MVVVVVDRAVVDQRRPLPLHNRAERVDLRLADRAPPPLSARELQAGECTHSVAARADRAHRPRVALQAIEAGSRAPNTHGLFKYVYGSHASRHEE